MVMIKRFEWYCEWSVLTCRYFNLILIPTLDLFVDNQMNETWIDNEGKIHLSHVGIGLLFQWLGVTLGVQVNFKTNKPLIL